METKCCTCSCLHCGEGKGHLSREEVKIYVCAAIDCFFQAKDLSDIYQHKDKKHRSELFNDDLEGFDGSNFNVEVDVDFDDYDSQGSNNYQFPLGGSLSRRRSKKSSGLDELEDNDSRNSNPAIRDHQFLDRLNLHPAWISISKLLKSKGISSNLDGFMCQLCNVEYSDQKTIKRSSHENGPQHQSNLAKLISLDRRMYFCGHLTCEFSSEVPHEVYSHQQSAHPSEKFRNLALPGYECPDEPLEPGGKSSVTVKLEVEDIADVFDEPDIEMSDDELPPKKKRKLSHKNGTASNCGIMGCKVMGSASELKNHRRDFHFIGPNFDPKHNQRWKEYYTAQRNVPNGGNLRRRMFYCKLCEYYTAFVNNIELHVVRVHFPEVETVSCEFCPYKTGHTHELKIHIRRKHRYNPNNQMEVSCKHCHKNFNSKDELQDHVKKNHSIETVHCPFCEYKTNIESVLRDHKVSVHPDKVENLPEMLCDLCGFKSSNKRVMRSHRANMHGSYFCDQCPDFFTTSNYEFYKHKSRVHRQMCSDCNTYLPYNQSLDKHDCPSAIGKGKPTQEYLDMFAFEKATNRFVRKMQGGGFICSECGLENSGKNFMLKHVKLCHGDHRCKSCDYVTTLRACLLKHIKYKHDLNCARCNKSFKDESELASHACLITPESQINANLTECPYCQFKPVNPKALGRHIQNVHLGIKRYSCEICRRKFSERNNYEQHMRAMHLGVKKYACDQCDFRCANHNGLKRHKETHGKYKEFECEYENCNFKTDALGNMRRHRQNVHLERMNIKTTELV